MTTTSDIRTTAKIKVIGIGGAGCDVITQMIQQRISGVEFIAMDTDKTALPLTGAERQIHLRKPEAYESNTGSDVIMGQKAAKSNSFEIETAIAGADVILLIAGLGGGTGTGATPYIAEIARRHNALTLAIVTRPFHFEGRFRALIAAEGIELLTKKADAVIAIDDERLLQLYPDMKINQAFNAINAVITGHVYAITELLTSPGLINLELANIKAVMQNAGPVRISSGKCRGRNRAIDVTEEIQAEQLSDISIKGAGKILLCFKGGSDLALKEVEQAVAIIRKEAGPDADIVFGVAVNEQMRDEIGLTLIASGFTGASDSKISSHTLRERQMAGAY